MLYVNPDRILQGDFFQSYPVVAPISGVIYNIKVMSGSYINPSEVMLNIYDNSKVRLKIQSYEKDLEYIKQGQSIDFETTEDSTYKAKVKLISPALDPETKSITIYADILSQGNFFEGMYVTSRLITDTKQVWTLPIDALIQEGQETYIYILQNTENGVNYFKKQPVDVVKKTENLIVLNENPYPGASIITQGAYMISD